MTTSPSAPTVPSRRPTFASTLRSEWRKFWSLPSTRTILISTVLVTVGLSAVVVVFGAGPGLAAAQRHGDYDAVLLTSRLGIWAFVFLGANAVATEFRTGLSHHTFVATPRRERVLAAKMVVVGIVGFVSGLVTTVVDLAITQVALALGGYPTLDIGRPEVLRVVLVLVGAGMAFEGMLGGLLAVLTRHAVGALVLTIVIGVVPITVIDFFGHTYQRIVPRWTTGALEESLAGLTTGDARLSTLPALLGVACYLAVVGAAAVARLRTADSV